MNTLLRILIILVVTTMIGGLMYVGVSASESSPGFESFDEEGGRPQPPEGAEFLPEREAQEEQGGRDGGFGFPAGMVKALVLMFVAGGIYSAITWTGKRVKKGKAG